MRLTRHEFRPPSPPVPRAACPKCGASERHGNGNCAPCARKFQASRKLTVEQIAKKKATAAIRNRRPDVMAANLERYKKRMEQKAGRPRPELCELCGSPPDSLALCFDHCHNSGKFRGWLCNRCNVTLGAVQDSSELLRKMADHVDAVKASSI